MRIRTVKPEFFTHPVLARLTETAKNLAIGLLCYADDEGYFLADPVLVRSAIRPFDDNSRSTHGALTELSKCGFISISEHPTHGKIGLVVNFSKHQVINRPTRSKLATYYTSSTTHGGISEDSQPEGKGMEQGKERNGSSFAPTTSIQMPTEGHALFPIVPKLQEWLSFKREKGSHYKETGWNALLTKISKYPLEHISWAIDDAMANNYSGFFPESYAKKNGAGATNRLKRKIADEFGRDT